MMVPQIKAMDSEHEQDDLKFLGFIGIFKESVKIILTWHKIFTQIILAFILPHSCLYLANSWISKHLSSKINTNYSALFASQVDSPSPSPSYNHITSDSVFSELAIYWLIKALYFIISIILSLLTVSAVIYTVACIYSGKKITFKRVISVVPKVWKQLLITFLCNFCIMFVYVCALTLVLIITVTIYFIFFFKPEDNMKGGILIMTTLIWIMVIIFAVGFLYLTIIWQLGNVISVMEKICGFKALKKSKDLIKGKMGTSFAILLVIYLCTTPVYQVMQKLSGFGIVEGSIFGILSLMLWSLLTLFGLVVQTVFYLVCKSYHHESIDKSLLADHLDLYFGEYTPLKTEDNAIQLEHLHV